MSIVKISATAIAEIKRIQAKQKSPQSNFRIAVKQGGCSGLFYEFSFVEAAVPIETELICVDCDGISVLLDTQTENYIRDLTIDYSEDLMGGGFRFYNQNAIATCECGNSFAVE